MNVGQLIEALEKYPPSTFVVISDDEGESYPLDNVDYGPIEGQTVVALGCRFWDNCEPFKNCPRCYMAIKISATTCDGCAANLGAQ